MTNETRKIVILPKKGKTKRTTQAIEYRNSLTNLAIDKNEIALLIIPSFSFEKQGYHEDDIYFSLEMLMNITSPKVRNLQKYCERIQNIAKLLEEVKDNINHFFVAQNTIVTKDWLHDLTITYQSLGNLSIFPHNYPKTIPRLWYQQEENSKMKIMTPTDYFWDLTEEKEGKFLNVLFLHNKRRNWIKNFFKGIQVRKFHILPTIPLFIFTIPK